MTRTKPARRRFPRTVASILALALGQSACVAWAEEAPPPPAPKAPTFRVRATWPATGTPAVLAPEQRFWVDLEYESAELVQVRVEGVGQGLGIGWTDTMPCLAAGKGTAVAWVASQAGGRLTGFEVTLRELAGSKRHVTERIPMDLRWQDDGRAAQEIPAWVARRTAEMRVLERPYPQVQAHVPLWLGLLMRVLLLVPLLALAWPIYGLVRWRGGWRVAAGAPLVALASIGVVIALNLSKDPTSHNLLGVELAMYAGVALAWMSAVGIRRRIVLRRPSA